MKKSNIANIKNRLSEYLGYVKMGDTVRIYDRDHPIADIVPISSVSRMKDGTFLENLEKKGIVRLRTEKLSISFVEELLLNSKKKNLGVLELLIDERRNGR